MILAVPVVGAVLYLLVGEARLGFHRIRRHKETDRKINPILPARRGIAMVLSHVSGPDRARAMGLMSSREPLLVKIENFEKQQSAFVTSASRDDISPIARARSGPET